MSDAYRYIHGTAKFSLQRGVAAAMIRMQMGVHHPRQGLSIQGVANQLQGLAGMRPIARVDEDGAVLAASNQHIVRRQPPALEDGDSSPLQHVVHVAHPLSCAAPGEESCPRSIWAGHPGIRCTL